MVLFFEQNSNFDVLFSHFCYCIYIMLNLYNFNANIKSIQDCIIRCVILIEILLFIIMSLIR